MSARSVGWLPALRRLQASEATAGARFAQLATLTPHGRPAVRTVVVRGVRRCGTLEITTDTRSAKAAELAACGWAELCWYFVDAREQLRLTGAATLVADPDDARRLALWKAMSPASRAAFYGPAPGAPVPTGASELQQPLSAPPADAEQDVPPEPFALLLLHVDKVDHLVLREATRRVWRRVNDGWESVDVFP